MNLQQLREKHQQLKSKPQSQNAGFENFLKVEDGKTIVRVLPWKDEEKQFFAESHSHRYTDAEGKNQTYYCRKPFGEDCPMCSFRDQLWQIHRERMGKNSKEKSKWGSLASAIKVSPRYLMNVISRKEQELNPDTPATWVKIFSTGKKVYEKILDTIFNPDYFDESDPDNTTILSLKKGNDFTIERVMVSEYPNYDKSLFRPKKTPAATDREIKAIMESLHDIHSMVKPSTYDEGKKIVEYLRSTLDTVKGPSELKSDSKDDGEQQFNEDLEV